MVNSNVKRNPWLRDVPQLPDDLARLAWSDEPLSPAVELRLALEVRRMARSIRRARLSHHKTVGTNR